MSIAAHIEALYRKRAVLVACTDWAEGLPCAPDASDADASVTRALVLTLGHRYEASDSDREAYEKAYRAEYARCEAEHAEEAAQ
jgi:hypothetical protein